MDNSAIDRRIEFLLVEAKSTSPIFCHVIQTCMRAVSNTLLFGFQSSRRAKAKARMSPQARSLRQKCTPNEFNAQTTLEHPYELRSVWQYMIEHDLSVEQAKALLMMVEPIVITKEEDALLRSSGATGIDRYKAIGIELDDCKRE